MSEFRPTDAELMQSVDWLGSPEAGLKLPDEFLSPVSDAIKLARKQAATIRELEKRAKGVTSMMINLTDDRVIDPQHVESLTWGRVRDQRNELIIRMVSGVELNVSVKGGAAEKVYDLIVKAKQGSGSCSI